MKIIPIVFVLLLITACSAERNPFITVHSTQSPDAAEALRLDPHADIIQLEDAIYQTGIDWVEEIEPLTKGEEIGEITKRTYDPKEFEHGSANMLPTGTVVYRAKERNDIVIVEINNEIKRYYLLAEG